MARLSIYMGLGAIQAASCNLAWNPHTYCLLAIGTIAGTGLQPYSYRPCGVQPYSRTAPNSLSHSLAPSLPFSPFSPCLPGMLRICGGVPHCYSCVGSSESIHGYLSQVHVLRGTLLLLMFIRWATGRCETGTAMLSHVTSWYI